MDENKEPEKTMGILKSISVLLSGAFAFGLVAGILGLISSILTLKYFDKEQQQQPINRALMEINILYTKANVFT